MSSTLRSSTTLLVVAFAATGCGIPEPQIHANVIVATAPFEAENISTCSTSDRGDPIEIRWINDGSRGRFYHIQVTCGLDLMLRLPADAYEEDTPRAGESARWGAFLDAPLSFDNERCRQIYEDEGFAQTTTGQLLLHRKGTDGFGGRNRTYIGQYAFEDAHECISGQIDFEIRNRD